MLALKPLTFIFADDGAVPNNPLPALLYKNAVTLGADPEGRMKQLFARNGWGRGQWRDGIYPFLHYHSMIHETLGLARSTARVRRAYFWGNFHTDGLRRRPVAFYGSVRRHEGPSRVRLWQGA